MNIHNSHNKIIFRIHFKKKIYNRLISKLKFIEKKGINKEKFLVNKIKVLINSPTLKTKIM